MDAQEATGGFSFKCHRDDAGNAWAVNCIDVQPDFGTANPPGRHSSFASVFVTVRQTELRNQCPTLASRVLILDRSAQGGGDGAFAFWDKHHRVRLNDNARGHNVPVTAMRWDPTGNYLAYAHGYDWHRGHAYARPTDTSLHIHATTEAEIRFTPQRR